MLKRVVYRLKTEPHCPAEIAKFAQLICTLYRQIPTNIQLNWIKRFFRGKQKQQFGDEVQGWHKDWSGLQLMKFDLLTGGQQIKLAILKVF